MIKPVILLHGALGAAAQLKPLKGALEERGRKVYTINFSGHGGVPFSEKGFGIDVFADDVFNFLGQEQIQTVDIFGYSMGGYVALWMAHQHPDRVNKIITLGTKFDWDPASAGKEIAKLDPEKIQTKVPAFARILEHRHAPNHWKELIARTSEMMYQLGQKPMLTEQIFLSLTHSTQILLGDQDDMADLNYSKKVASLLPNGTFHMLQQTPHAIEKVSIEKLLASMGL